MFIDLQTKVNNYIDSNNGMKLLSYDAVLGKMLAENKLTRAEYDKLMSTSIFSFSGFESGIGDDIGSIMGLNFSNIIQKTETAKKEEVVEVKTLSPKEIQENLQKEDELKAKLKEFLASIGLEIIDDLTYKHQRFDMNFLKSIYDESKYEFIDNDSLSITVKPKTDGYTSEGVLFYKDGTGVVKYNSKGEQEIGFYSFEQNADGNKSITSLFSEDQHFSYRSGLLKSADFGYTTIEIDENKEVKAINYRNSNHDVIKREDGVVNKMLEVKDDPEALSKLVQEKVSYENVGMVLSDFKEKSGIDLLDGYFNPGDEKKYTLGLILMEKIVYPDLLTFYMYDEYDYENEKKVEYFTECIEKALESKNSDLIYQTFLLMDSNTVYGILNKYRNKKQEKSDVEIPMLPITSLVQKLEIMGYSDIVAEAIVPSLQDADLLVRDPELAEFMLEEIPKLLEMQVANGAYVDDIKSDYVKNEGDIKKQLIDFKRAMTRNKPIPGTDVTKPDGKFNDNVEQGRIGDCWLLAGLMSIYKKEKGREYLETLVETNVSGDSVIVKLPGVKKKYEITWQEIKANAHLVNGDGDVRALEIAIDKYIKEQAYDKKFTSRVDINGNTSNFIYDLLIGTNNIDNKTNDYVSVDVDMKQFDTEQDFQNFDVERFNDPNSFYSMSFSGKTADPLSLEKAAVVEETGEKVNLHTQHAYAVLKLDEKYVYLINPWNSEEILKVETEKLASLPTRVAGRSFDMDLMERLNSKMLFKFEENNDFYF